MKRMLFVVLMAAALLGSQTKRLPQTTVRLLDGRKATLRELHAEGPLLIDFWALWCAPCLKAMRHLDAFQSSYGDRGLQVLTINLDTERSRSKVRSYLKSRGYGFQTALDPSNDTFRRLSGNALPYTLLIDRSGQIIYRHTGYVPGDEQALERHIAALLDPARSPAVPQDLPRDNSSPSP